MENFNSYGFIIAASIIIIISYFFNILAKKSNIPSVIFLIALGILIKQGLKLFNMADNLNLFPTLEVLGIIGLVLIVLEAALDLKLKRDKLLIITKSFIIALLSLIITSIICALIIQDYIHADFFNSLIYAIPLSILSSAIIIPSVSNLDEGKKEFMVYESTFSDIFGILFFYFIIQNTENRGIGEVSFSIFGNIFVTVIVSLLISYALVFIFQKIRTEVKLFLLISILILLYSVGKLLHLSSLLIILVFGLILGNRHIFFRGLLKKYLKEETIKNIFSNFKVITMESSFIIRTFFFILFGITITLGTLLDFDVFLVSFAILAVIFGARFLCFLIFMKGNLYPHILIAPRGLITILLFFAIPTDFQIKEFNEGVVLFIIMISSIIMSIALIKHGKKRTPENKTGTIEKNSTLLDEEINQLLNS